MSEGRACRKCFMLYDDNVKKCPVCQIPTSETHSGFVGIINPEKSEVAKKIEERTGIKVLSGRYVLNVR